jgi:hypothetical protein
MLQREILRFMRRYPSGPAPEKDFNGLALRVFVHQFEKNALYRRFCEMEGVTPASIHDWKRIPAMPATAFKELVLTSFPARKKVKVFKTSGTSTDSAAGPGRGAHYFETLALYKASILPPFRKHVLKSDASYYFLMPSDKEAPASSLSYMMKVVNERFALKKGCFFVRRGRPDYGTLARDLMKERKKALLLATAFALKGFLDYLEKRGLRLRLKPGSRLMETGGFKGRRGEVPKAELYRLCRARLGLSDFVSEYGMTELSSQYYSRNGGVFAAPAWMRAVVMDPRTGKECPKGRSGLLKHVDLANLGSVMAVQTEDLGRAKGKGFELLGRLRGSEARGCSLTYERFLRGEE